MRRARLTTPVRGRRRRPVGEGRADGWANWSGENWGIRGVDSRRCCWGRVGSQGSESGKLSGVIWVVFFAAVAAIPISGNDESW